MTRYDSGLDRSAGMPDQAPVLFHTRQRVTLAQVNAGFTLLPAIAGKNYRIVDASMLAVGGAGAAATSVNIIGTRAAAPVQLFVAAVARLVQSVLLRTGTPFATAGAESLTTLADGASFTSLDANTPVTIITVGSALTTLTAIDVMLAYVIEG